MRATLDNKLKKGATKMGKRIVFITGGNKGLGYETARRLKVLGYKVYIGARDPKVGAEAAKTLDISWLQIDVTSEVSVRTAATLLSELEGHLDILINNAGISAPRKNVVDLTGEDAEIVFGTNTIAPVRVMNAFIPLLEKSKAPVIVNVSSGLGSFTFVHNSDLRESKVLTPLYSASKSALTMLTVQYARALSHMRINAADPGATATDLNGHMGAQTVTEGSDSIVYLATLPADGPTGTFVGRHGTIPW